MSNILNDGLDIQDSSYITRLGGPKTSLNRFLESLLNAIIAYSQVPNFRGKVQNSLGGSGNI